MSNVLRIVLLTVVTIFILCYNVYIQPNGSMTVHIMLLTQGAGFVHEEHYIFSIHTSMGLG